MAYNISRNESSGFSPYNILYGIEVRSPLLRTDEKRKQDTASPKAVHNQIRQKAHENMRQSHLVQKFYYDKRHSPQEFQIFDLVLLRREAVSLRDPAKLAHKWVGPYIILKLIHHTDEPQAVVILDISC